MSTSNLSAENNQSLFLYHINKKTSHHKGNGAREEN